MCCIAYDVRLVFGALGSILVLFNSRLKESLFTRSILIEFFTLLRQP